MTRMRMGLQFQSVHRSDERIAVSPTFCEGLKESLGKRACGRVECLCPPTDDGRHTGRNRGAPQPERLTAIEEAKLQ